MVGWWDGGLGLEYEVEGMGWKNVVLGVWRRGGG